MFGLVIPKTDGIHLLTKSKPIYFPVSYSILKFQHFCSRLGNHPNFQVAGQHRSGRVTPPRPSTAKGKEKRRREDDVDDDESAQDLTGSPRPKAAVRPRPNIVDVNVPNVHASTPTLRAHAVAAAAGHPLPQAGPSNRNPSRAASAAPAVPAPPVTEAPTVASILLESRASAADLQTKLLSFRQAQLELDQRNSSVREQLIAGEQLALEEERVHRLELDAERAEREAAELEERVNCERRSQYFDQCLRIASSNGLPSDLVELASQQLREAIEAGMNFKTKFVSPRTPSTSRLVARRAASVPVHTSTPGALQTPNQADVPTRLHTSSATGSNTTTATQHTAPSQDATTSLTPSHQSTLVTGFNVVPPSSASVSVHANPTLASGHGSAPPSHAQPVLVSGTLVAPSSTGPVLTTASTSHAHKPLGSGPVFGPPQAPGVLPAVRLASPSLSSRLRNISSPTVLSTARESPGPTFQSPGSSRTNVIPIGTPPRIQPHTPTSRMVSSHLRLEVNPDALVQRPTVNQGILEPDDTVSPSGEGFVHIDSTSYRYTGDAAGI